MKTQVDDYLGKMIDKGMNGSYVPVNGSWYRVIEITGTCYGFPENGKVRGCIVLENHDSINDRVIVDKAPVDKAYIDSLPYRGFWF